MNQNPMTLQQLQQADYFADRHIGPDQQDQLDMLHVLGLNSLDEMVQKIVPESIRRQDEMAIDKGLTEHQSLARLKQMAAKMR